MDYRTRRTILALALVIGAVGLVVAGYRAYRVIDMRNLAVEAPVEAGKQLGRGTSAHHCVAASLERADDCALWDVRCETEASFFAAGCMMTSRGQTAICSEFHRSGNIGADALFGRNQAPAACRRRDREGDTGCEAVMARVAQICLGGPAFDLTGFETF